MNYVVKCWIEMKEIFMFGIIEIGYHLLVLMVKKMNLLKKKYI